MFYNISVFISDIINKGAILLVPISTGVFILELCYAAASRYRTWQTFLS